MTDETLAKLEERLRQAASLEEPQRQELLQLLRTLRSEITDLSRTKAEHAASIARFIDVSTHEAIRAEANPRLRELSLDGLRSSVEGFERSHPRLVEAVNAVSNMLANIGI